MGKPKSLKGSPQGALNLWSSRSRPMTAKNGLEEILASVTGLPVSYWKERMFFRGLKDSSAFELTGGRFPARPGQGTHPVFSLKALPDGIGFKVCPCSSKKPYDQRTHRYISEGCRLLYTGHAVDRNSYLIEKIQFNIPRGREPGLRFLGQVPEECIRHE